MKSKLILSLAALSTMLWAAEAQAQHQSGSYAVELLINGAPQPVYSSGGQSFVAGAYGAAYQIRVNNRSGRRIEAVVAIDGRDVVTGQPVHPRRHRGYIIQPWSSASIDGFRSSTATVAAFRFSSIPESYAWRTGTSWGIGTVRVWIFEEEAPPPMIGIPTLPYGGAPGAPSARNAPSADAAEGAPQAMGTAYGEQRYSPVAYTSFVRSSRRAASLLGLRYNSREMLQSAGIIPVYNPYPYPVVYPEYYPTYSPGPFAPPPPNYNPPRHVYRW
jgi:hypothetical protein